MDTIVPGTGAFAPLSAARVAGTVAAPTAAPVVDLKSVEAVRRGLGKRRRAAWGKLVALWTLLVMMLLAIWQFLEPDAPTRAPSRAPPVVEPDSPFWSDWMTGALVATLLALFLGRVALTLFRARRGGRELTAAVRAVALEDPAGADRIATIAAKAPPAIAAGAAHWLAELADARGDFASALAAAETGIAKISTRALEAATSDWVLPELWSDRAPSRSSCSAGATRRSRR